MKKYSLDIPAIKFGIILISETEDDYDSKFLNFDQIDGLTFKQLLSFNNGIDLITDIEILAYVDLSNQIDVCHNKLLTEKIKVVENLKDCNSDISSYFLNYIYQKMLDPEFTSVISGEKIFSTFASRYMGLDFQTVFDYIMNAKKSKENNTKNDHL